MNQPFLPPVILDFDNSVEKFKDECRIPLQTWQEKIRFGCSHKQFAELGQHLNQALPAQYGCVLMGSGDYHHITQLLLKRLPTDEPIQLIVCDNHPDNMRYPLGIHCGSWVYWASRLPQVKSIDVLGICSQDISVKHCWENHLTPLRSGKLTYWNIGVNTHWLKWVGAKNSAPTFSNVDQLMESFLAQMDPSLPIYLSIDKDVLSDTVVNTNWDQGQFLQSHLEQLIAACHGRLVGADINGEVSEYTYQSRVKRFLSACDGQEPIASAVLADWQRVQNELNQQLVVDIQGAFRV